MEQSTNRVIVLSGTFLFIMGMGLLALKYM